MGSECPACNPKPSYSCLQHIHSFLLSPVLFSEGGHLFSIQRTGKENDAACQSSPGFASHCANYLCQNSQKLWTCLPQCQEMHGCSGWIRGKQARAAWEHGYHRARDLRSKVGQGQEKGLHL